MSADDLARLRIENERLKSELHECRYALTLWTEAAQVPSDAQFLELDEARELLQDVYPFLAVHTGGHGLAARVQEFLHLPPRPEST